jgi:hypothetical protein
VVVWREGGTIKGEGYEEIYLEKVMEEPSLD